MAHKTLEPCGNDQCSKNKPPALLEKRSELGTFKVQCQTCGTETPTHTDKIAIVCIWNERQTPFTIGRVQKPTGKRPKDELLTS